MSIDLNTLSAGELDSLINQAKRRKTQLKKRKSPAAVRARLESIAATEGYSMAELYVMPGSRGKGAKGRPATKKAAPAKGRKLGKVAPKYRNPANTKETWTGRGLKPRWMAELLKKGKKVEDFLIK